MSKKDTLAAFEAYAKANARVEAARKALDQAIVDRSSLVEQIAVGTGSRGPFAYKGAQLTISCRTNKETGESTWFFRGPSKSDLIEVG
jgi:hypothetical protein